MATVEVHDVPDRIDVRILAGRPFELVVAVMDGAGAVNEASILSARAHVRASVSGQDILHIFSSEDVPADIVIGGGAAGTLTISATSETTSLWQQQWPGTAPETVAWWDIEFTDDSSDEPRQLCAPGTIALVWEVTR